jgi:hypothetical protein
MLFEFGFFWKFLVLMLLTWAAYGIWGFEFTTVSILAALLAIQVKKT